MLRMVENNLKEVRISKEYYNEIEKIIEQSSQFKTVSDYVNFVLKEMLFGDTGSRRTEREEELIKKRLQDLGYIDAG